LFDETSFDETLFDKRRGTKFMYTTNEWYPSVSY
jgi:hypothetical protein